MNLKSITGLANGTASTDAVTKAQLDAVSAGAAGSYVLKSGDTMTGNLNLTSYNLTTTGILTGASINTGNGAMEVNSIAAYLGNQNLRTTDAPTFATINTGNGANELYAMNQNVTTTSSPKFAGINLTANITMNSNRITGLGNGSAAQDAVTKSQLDAVSAGAAGSYVLKSGDTMTGNLNMSGTSANVILGSNWLSGDGEDEGVFVNSVGNVGIGTTSPTLGKLQVNGGIYSDNFRTDETTTHNVFVGDDAGGTGTYSTAVGEHAGEGNTGSSQTALGYYVGYYNAGSSQTALGMYAGYANTGSYQTALGYSAGYANTGSSQTALGNGAGYSNTGSSQTALGYGAGQSNIGSSQTALGYYAGRFNTGSSQTALGMYAGQSNTGSSQTALGMYAGEGNTGTYQTALGYSAGYYNTGSSQTALGYYAGQSNTGSSQTALGYQAGQFNTGSSQTALGYNAGLSNTGSSQTALGYYAGLSNTGSSQTALGYYAGYYNTGSSQTALGYNAGYYNDGAQNTAIGNEAFNAFNLDASKTKTFDYTAINAATNYITLTAHGLGTTGTYLNMKFVQGTSAITGMTNNEIYRFKIIDANTLELANYLTYITAVGTGTGHTLTPQFVYSNSVALGYDAEPDASNQIVLGNSAVTQVKTAGSIYSTGTGDNYFGGKIGIGTTTPLKKFHVNGTKGGFLIDVDNTVTNNPTVNTTSGNVTITSAGGSVIIRLG